MRALKCECGESKWFGLDAPKSCDVCKDCGTNAYGTKPDNHIPTTEEIIRDSVIVKKRTYCKTCLKRLDG